MIYSGVDLIRTSGQQAERLHRLSVVPPIGEPRESAAPGEDGGGGGRDGHPQEAMDALRRFAKFMNEERDKKRPSEPLAKRQLRRSLLQKVSDAYTLQARVLLDESPRGSIIDVYI